MSVGPSTGWSARREVEPLDTGSHTAECLRYRRSDPQHQWDSHLPWLCAQCRETQVWGFLGLRCCSQGYVGRWLFFIFFSFVLQLGGHLGFQLVYILKPLFLYPSCCTVTLNVLQMNENPPLKLLTIQCLSFFGTTFGIFNRLMARRSHQRAIHMTGY